MKWHDCNSIDDLKKIGSFNEVKVMIKADLPNRVRISLKGWQDILDSILLLRNIFGSSLSCKSSGVDGFVSEEEKYLFCLTRLDGADRQDLLGITRDHYRDPSVAAKWYKRIAQKIHPDSSKDPRAESAFKTLKRIYSEMSK